MAKRYAGKAMTGLVLNWLMFYKITGLFRMQGLLLCTASFSKRQQLETGLKLVYQYFSKGRRNMRS